MQTISNFQIIRSQRRTIAVLIAPTGELIVKAPLKVSDRAINSFLSQNEEWIQEHLEKAGKKPAVTKHTYTNGDTFLFLGEKVILTIGNYAEVKVRDGKLLFPQSLVFRIKKELETFYIRKAREMIAAQVARYAKDMGAEYKEITFSDTKSQWGRCTHDNRLQFSWRLTMAPLLVVNYVVVHELAHTFEKNHTQWFWGKVRNYNPSYRQQIKWLKENGHTLVI